tara:strand:- start:22 stop:222 length:201 start_codon:yes stop_codon:yes gene_type:complete
MTREEFDERVNKTLVSMDVTHYSAEDNPEEWDGLFEFYQHVPEEALEVMLMEAIDKHRRGDGAMYN